jgi:hypothetical protein
MLISPIQHYASQERHNDVADHPADTLNAPVTKQAALNKRFILINFNIIF